MEFTQRENKLLLQAVQKYGQNFTKVRHLLPNRSKMELMSQFQRLSTQVFDKVDVLEPGSSFQRRTGRSSRFVKAEQEDIVFFSAERLEELKQHISAFLQTNEM